MMFVEAKGILNHTFIFLVIEIVILSLVLEYVEGKWDCEGSGPPGGLGEGCARKFLRDIVSGLMYLHSHVSSLFLSL